MEPMTSTTERTRRLYLRVIILADNPGTWDRIQALAEAGMDDDEILRTVRHERAAGRGISGANKWALRSILNLK